MPGKTIVTFYHSAVCPRCHLSNLALKRVLRERADDVEVERVEILKDRKRAKAAGIRSIPTLVAGGQVLAGFVLTPARIERFLAALASGQG